MLEIGILKNFDSGTYKAGVQLAGSLTTYFDDISVAKNIPSSALVIGNYVILAIPGGNPRDACVIATWPGGTPGGGGGSFLDLSDTPGSYSGQAGKTVIVKPDASGLEFTVPYDFVHRASRLGFNPHIWAGTDGYQKSASNPVINDQDAADITGVSLATIQAGIGMGQSVVRVHDGKYYMFVNIDIGGGAVANRSLYLISSTTPDFASYTNHGKVISTSAGTYYERLIYSAGLIYDPFASGSGTDRHWKMPVGCWGLIGGSYQVSFSWAYADAITGPWTILSSPIEYPVMHGKGAELIGRMIYYARVNAGSAPYHFQAYQADVGDYDDFTKYTSLGDVTPSLSGDYNNGFRFFSLFKHADGLYLVSYNEGSGSDNLGNIYLMAGGRFGQGQFEVQKCSPVLKHGTLTWEASRIISPWLLLEENDVFLYYTGVSAAPVFCGIGLASLSGNW